MVKKIFSFASILTIFVAYKSLKEETKMKWISIATVLLVLVSVESTAQITIKTEYFGTSAYRDEHNQKVGSSKGSAMVYHGSANLPLSMKKNESNQPTIWGIGAFGRLCVSE